MRATQTGSTCHQDTMEITEKHIPSDKSSRLCLSGSMGCTCGLHGVFLFLDPKYRLGDPFRLAHRAASGSRETLAILEDIVAVQALWGLGKDVNPFPGGSPDVGQVLQNLFFPNPQNTGEVSYREFFFSEQLCDSLPDGQDRPPLQRAFMRRVTVCVVTRPALDPGGRALQAVYRAIWD
jgi:hypothetical protein